MTTFRDDFSAIRTSRVLTAIVAVILAVTTALTAAREAQTAPLLVFAAASLQTALDELSPAIERSAGARVRMSYAASSALARQIENDAPADVFISADLDWMNYVAERRLIQPETRVNLVGNTLVLVAPAGRNVSLKIGPGFPLAAALGQERLAVADPTSVPAGKYAQAALTSLGVWSAVANKIAAAENVRGALLLVSRGEAPLGIVYKTDAVADRGVAVVDTFPASTHPAIVYPAAATAHASAGAARVLAFLRSADARAAFARQGFLTDMP